MAPFRNATTWRHDDGAGDWTTEIRPHPENLELGDAFERQIEHFSAVITGRETPRITAEDASRSLRATLAVREAANTGQRVIL